MPTTRIQLESGAPAESGRRDAEKLVAQKRGLLWIDLIAPSEAELVRLQRTFEFHPLSIEDSSHFRQRAKVVQYDGYLFITLYSHRYDVDRHRIVAEELHIFLGSNYLVTVHQTPLPPFSKARSVNKRKLNPLRR